MGKDRGMNTDKGKDKGKGRDLQNRDTNSCIRNMDIRKKDIHRYNM
jgi:hypothetical protein